jgi:hypothetical protein
MRINYTLNLGFDLDVGFTRFGEFLDRGNSPDPLQQSKVWLPSELPPTDPNVKFGSPVNGGDLIASRQNAIYLRLFYAGGLVQRGDLAVQVILVFGRKEGQTQTYRSPFSFPDTQIAQTVFEFPVTPLDTEPAWVFCLGPVTNSSGITQVDRYGFVVAARVWVPAGAAPLGVPYTFGYDPDFDVSMVEKPPLACTAS